MLYYSLFNIHHSLFTKTTLPARADVGIGPCADNGGGLGAERPMSKIGAAHPRIAKTYIRTMQRS